MKKIVLLVAFLVSLPVQAAIVDYGSYFQDTDTGLYWLKVTETRDKNYDDAANEFGVGQPFLM